MKRISALAFSAALLALAACSDSDDAKSEAEDPAAAPAQQAPAQQAPAQQTPAPQSAAPAGQPLSLAQQQALAEAAKMPRQGTVLELMHASGYTYMKVDVGSDKPLWVAVTMMRAQPNDKVQWGEAAVMHNYDSKSLHRTFDMILFASSASVIN
ncbi:MAG: hypothetical protein L3J88_13390 [Gammaproteobacteria bacterium]|nr:hypothetical protein [Gammaproteobacteria bacterium]MCF6364307.1 hypothetical protein [Gammaproteobacteria bacterium]